MEPCHSAFCLKKTGVSNFSVEQNGILVSSQTVLAFYIPFNCQGFIWTDPQHLPFVGVEPRHRREPVDAKHTITTRQLGT